MIHGDELCRWKRAFVGFLCPSEFKKLHLSYKKGTKTYDFLKIELVCELAQKESDQNIKMGRKESFIRPIFVRLM